jgi:hypothetical protein
LAFVLVCKWFAPEKHFPTNDLCAKSISTPPPNLIFLGRKRGSEHLRDSDVRGGRRAGRQRVRRWGRALGLSSGPAFRGTTLGASAVGDSTPTDHPDPYERGGGSRPGNVFRQSHVSIRKIVSSQTPPPSPTLDLPLHGTSSVPCAGATHGDHLQRVPSGPYTGGSEVEHDSSKSPHT